MFADYAQRIGADYRFDLNPNFFRHSYARYYHSLRPIFDPVFHEYDRVLFVDMDVFPRENLERNVFDEPLEHIALVQEPGQEELRKKRAGKINWDNDLRWADYVDEKWGLKVPRGIGGNPHIFNTGVILFSKEGMLAAQKLFPAPWLYVLWMRLKRFPWFYRIDQNYLSAFAFLPNMRFTPLNQDWNSQIISSPLSDGTVQTSDFRSESSALVHFQYKDRNTMAVADILAMVNDGK